MPSTTEEFAERMMQSALGAIEIYSIHIGDRLGFYRALRDGPLTGSDLAERTSVNERYVREWLEQQATTGIIDVDFDSDQTSFSLSPDHAEVLANHLSRSYLAPLARMLTASGEKMALLLDAYRDGTGVAWQEFGPDMRESQADMNRPFFDHDLSGVLAGLPTVHERLYRPGARAADIGCGAGWSTLSLARAYPEAKVCGYDVDEPSIEMARNNAAVAGFSDRVTFSSDDIGMLEPDQTIDVAFAFECTHDMPRPISVLAAMREMVGDDGIVVVMDEAVGDEFTGPGDDIDKLMYGFSLLVCLPDGLSSQPSVGTGTVLRQPKMEAYAVEAGFSRFQFLAEAHLFRFYELAP